MTSERPQPDEAYVWIWLPDAREPIVAGRIEKRGEIFLFNYGRSYLARNDAIPIYREELPLEPGVLAPDPPLLIANCLRDGAPDAWGRRVIVNRLTGSKGAEAAAVEFDELTYLLESGSDRIGALDFQASPAVYAPRGGGEATLTELQASADKVLAGEPLHPELDRALHHGSSIGGARPKALFADDARKLIAKFSTSSDTYNVVKAEFIAMRLARACQITVAGVDLAQASGKDIILVERFDRQRSGAGWTRRAMVSALTLFGLDEVAARHASYEDLAHRIRKEFSNPRQTLRELFGRVVFNVLVGNTDDHARNHAAFWDGQTLSLTPAYDICPQARTAREVNQAMKISGNAGDSRLATVLQLAPACHLSEDDACDIIRMQVGVISSGWRGVCNEARLSEVDEKYLWRRQFLHPFAFDSLPDALSGLREWAD
jgi:serine/threonine-protein kinase HipA